MQNINYQVWTRLRSRRVCHERRRKISTEHVITCRHRSAIMVYAVHDDIASVNTATL